LRWLIAKTFEVYERWACAKIDEVITETPFIRDKFLAINPISLDINNFPILGELAEGEIDWSKKKIMCVVWGVRRIRGIQEVVKALGLVNSDARLQLCGKFSKA
jgi:hypothetical protein